MNLSKRLPLALLALCPAAAMTTSASADWWNLFDPLGAIVVGNPADLPEEEDKSFTGETPTVESVLEAWGTPDEMTDLDGSGMVDLFDLIEVLELQPQSAAPAEEPDAGADHEDWIIIESFH